MYLSAVLLAGSALPARAGAADGRGAVVASLDGEAAVTENEVSDWQAAQACYGEGAIVSRKAAFMRLLEAAIAEKALKGAGAIDTGDAGLRAEAARIDRETRAPEILACVKKKLGAGSSAYLRVFVRPVLIETGMREFIGHNAAFQDARRKRLEDGIKTVMGGGGMSVVAGDMGLSYSTATYSVHASSGPLPLSMVDRGFAERYLSGLGVGELRKESIETEAGFVMARLISEKNGERVYEFASLPKLSQKEWLMTLPKMKLKINDEKLRLWTMAINGNPRLVAVHIE
jgi:hypothetical protein